MRAAFVSFALTVFMHVLPPLPFAQTQMLFDYSHGLVRRGLVGSVLNPIFGSNVSLGESFAAAYVLNMGAAIAVFGLGFALLRHTVASLMVLVLMVCSYGYATFISNSGYLDTVLMMLTVVALIAGAGRVGTFVALIAVVLAVLTHENMLPYFTVLIGFSIWLAGSRDMTFGNILHAVSPIAAGAMTVIALMIWGQMSPEAGALFGDMIRAKAEFAIDPDATDIAARGLAQNFAHMSEIRANGSYWTWLMFDGGLLGGMSLFLIVMNGRMLVHENIWTQLAMVGAIVAPLTLNLIAFDIGRFGAISVVNGFICTGLILRYVEGAPERLAATLQWPVFVFVLVINLQIATMQLNQGVGHTTRFPYVIKHQLDWMLIPMRATE
jgi:hypothetical protein